MRRLFLLLALATSAQAADPGHAAPDFTGGGQWLNARPTHIQDLRGKVLIVNVWVYSCINCYQSLPTLQRWYDRYKAQGLEIVGVHTPEFESDKPAASVAAALRREGVTWPVVQDNASNIWNAYGNTVWPTFYLIDRSGKVRAVHEGEISRRYPDAIPGLEKTIQALLKEK